MVHIYLADQRRSQGCPERLEDPVILAQVAHVLGPTLVRLRDERLARLPSAITTKRNKKGQAEA